MFICSVYCSEIFPVMLNKKANIKRFGKLHVPNYSQVSLVVIYNDKRPFTKHPLRF